MSSKPWSAARKTSAALAQRQRGPARIPVVVQQNEPVGMIGGGHAGGLTGEQPRQHERTVGRDGPRQPRRKAEEWAREDVGYDEVVTAIPAMRTGTNSVRHPQCHAPGRSVAPRVRRSDTNRVRIGIDGIDKRLRQGAGHGNGKHAGAAAEIEHAPESLPARKPLDGEQAAEGRGMVSGAEGLARIDLDRVRAACDPPPIVAAVDHEAACAHGRERRLRQRHPVLVWNPFNPEIRKLVPNEGAQLQRDGTGVGLVVVVGLEPPAALRGKERHGLSRRNQQLGECRFEPAAERGG